MKIETAHQAQTPPRALASEGEEDRAMLAGACLVELPAEWAEFLDVKGPAPVAPADARQFRRAFCRGYAVARIGAAHFAVITCDVSGGGLSFLHHDQLFPGDEVEIYLPGCAPVNLQVARCTKRGARCYICGARGLTADDRQMLIKLVRTCANEQKR